MKTMKCFACGTEPTGEPWTCECGGTRLPPVRVDSLVRCVWRVDNDGVWNSDCGQAHVFIDGTPGQNGFGFCPYCGKPMAEIDVPNATGDRT